MPQRPIQDAAVTEGGYGKIQPRDAAKPHSPISLIPLRLSLLIGLTRADAAKSGRTIATPPKAGGHVAPAAVRCGTPFLPPHEGRYRPHLSLREGSEQPPAGALTEGRRTL